MFIGTLLAIANGIAQPLTIILFGDLIEDFIKYGEVLLLRSSTVVTGNITTAAPPPLFDIDGEMTKFAGYYGLIGAGSLLAAYVHTAFWSLASVRQAKRIRSRCFKEILRKDIGWFDKTDAGELSSRITEYVSFRFQVIFDRHLI